jgi:hypothetical protein
VAEAAGIEATPSSDQYDAGPVAGGTSLAAPGTTAGWTRDTDRKTAASQNLRACNVEFIG